MWEINWFVISSILLHQHDLFQTQPVQCPILVDSRPIIELVKKVTTTYLIRGMGNFG